MNEGLKTTYINQIIKQYIEACNIKKYDIYSEQFIEDLYNWIKKRQQAGQIYSEFISSLDAHPQIPDCLGYEIGKGTFDTLANYLNVGIITPYTIGMKTKSGLPTINGELDIQNSGAIIVRPRNKRINTNVINRFLTHNPYTIEALRNWEIIHNSQKANITVGIYGHTYDKDYAAKVREIASFREKLEDYYEEESATFEDTYCYAISSNRLTKTLTKTLTYF